VYRGIPELIREIEILQAVRHPGVVELLGVEDGPDGPVLLTAPADVPTLARLPGITLEEVAGVVAAVASTVADLHDLGLVHGGLTADQVLVGEDGRPVLRGFGHGGRIGEPATGPGSGEAVPLDPATDVFALGALIRAFAEGAGDARNDRGRRGTAEALLSLADRATAPDPRLRLSARALADAVRHAVPDARLPRRPTADPAAVAEAPPAESGLRLRRPLVTPARANRRPWVLVGTAMVAVAAVGLALLTTGRPVPPASPEPAAPVATSAPLAASTTAPTRREPVTTAPARGCPEVTAGLSADTNGDGCPEALRWADGIVEVGGERWSVGLPGDLVVTGDWACRGMSTLALLRPGTGDVFVFDGWASPGHDVAATPLARVDGAFGLRPSDLDADGCPELLVERTGGPPVQVPRP
jgi:hypothetical protein